MMNIGIVCEGPTDYIILSSVIDKITGENNYYVQLQPEPDLTGANGNGWKGVWKWCCDHAGIKQSFMKDIVPALDVLIVQMDGDVSRKEKIVHCWCDSVSCEHKGKKCPLECDKEPKIRNTCPIMLPCHDHKESVEGHMEHLRGLIGAWIKNTEDMCIVVPCDSIEAWVIAAYDGLADVESIDDPWIRIIAKGKHYHGIRISGDKKKVGVYRQFAEMVCMKWKQVTELCLSAKMFEKEIVGFWKN